MADKPLIDVKLSERQSDRVVVGVTGELGHGSIAAFLDAVRKLRADGDRHLILDLSACVFCDSAGNQRDGNADAWDPGRGP